MHLFTQSMSFLMSLAVMYTLSSVSQCLVFRTLNRRNFSHSWPQCWSCGRMNTAPSSLSGWTPGFTSSRAENRASIVVSPTYHTGAAKSAPR